MIARRKKSSDPHNTVTIDSSGVIRLTYQGAQTRQSLRMLTSQLFQLMASQRRAGKKVYILADMHHISHADSSARLEAKQFLEEADYDALAVVGNRYLQPFIFFVLRDFKSRKSVAYFSNKTRALKWLLHSNHHTHTSGLRLHNRLKWAIAPLITMVLIGTFVSWQQANSRLEAESDKHFTAAVQTNRDALENRMRTYIDALYGFRGLFHSSEDVSEREYHDYFTSLDLLTNYPGFNSIDYISRVTDREKATFFTKVRSDNSLQPGSNQNFQLIPNNNRAEHFIVTYVGVEGVSGGKGVDLATKDDRRPILETARDSGQPTATRTVQVLSTEGQERANRGFTITIPVYQDSVPASVPERREANQGFVNAVFDYGKLFNHLFKGVDSDDISLQLHDADGAVIYQKSSSQPTTQKHTTTVPVTVAGQPWTLTIQAPRLFGVSPSETTLPTLAVAFGLLLTVALTVVLIVQNRSRQRAIDLASAMTEDIKQERNLAIATKNKDEAILSSIGDAVLVLDTNQNITVFNKAAEHLSGFSTQEALGQPYQQIIRLFDESNDTKVTKFIIAALAGKKTEMPKGTMLKSKTGTLRSVADSAAPVYDADNQIIGAVIVFRDITHERQVERMKDEFLSVASHELRTPMGAIRALVAMILSGDYGPVNKGLIEPLNDVKDSTIRLVGLVNDLLNVARLEAGRMKFTLDEFDIQRIIKETITSLTPLGKEKGIKMSYKTRKSILVQSDMDKLKQVLTNLVGNSLKFTDKGSIEVSFTSHGDMVEVEITDTGIGITLEDQSKLFGKFEQVVSAQKGKPQGTGLGLYISREIIRKIGGELYLKRSVPKKGTTFAFTVPRINSKVAKKVKHTLEREASLHPDQK